ncbi:MAG: TRAP transporter large permease [Thermodesulfobacteriota bacterium]|jgi:C4-dicarboxylate transporter, DctM subunit
MLLLMAFLFVFLLFSGTPVYLFMFLPAVVVIFFTLPEPMTIANISITSIQNFTLISIPLFIFTGNLCSRTGMAKYLIRFLDSFIGHLTGGLAIAAILAAVFFAGITGSSAADASAIGLLLIKPMVEAGYERKFVTALLAAGATIGLIVPPSIPLILYGYLAEESVEKLFIGGLLPSVMIAFALGIYSVWYCKKKGYGRKTKATGGERIRSFVTALPILGVLVIVMGTIYSGITTPTETAAIASVYALFISVFIYKCLNWTLFKEIVLRTVRFSGMIFLIIAGSLVMSFFLTYDQTPQKLTQFIISQNLSPAVFLLAINILLLLLGIPIEPPPLIFMIVPLIAPVLGSLGIDKIHFAIIFMINMQIAICSPPVGINLFIISGIAEAPTHEIFKSIIPFAIILVCMLFIITYVPSLSLVFVR